jgi:hypothetical protein
MVTQATVACFTAFLGTKESDPDVLPLEHIGDPRGNVHVAGVEA